FCFRNDGRQGVWLSSADWMDRNLHRRVESAFPVRDERLKERVIHEAITLHLRDNDSAWTMDGDGRYTRLRARRSPPVVSQRELMKLFAEKSPELRSRGRDGPPLARQRTSRHRAFMAVTRSGHRDDADRSRSPPSLSMVIPTQPWSKPGMSIK